MQLIQKQIVHRKKPVNIIPEEERFFRHEYIAEIPEVDFTILQPAYLLRDAIFSFRFFKFYWSYTHFLVPGLRNKLSRFKLFFNKPLIIEDATWISNQWSAGYFHWFTDALPRLLAVKDKTSCRKIILPDKYAAFAYVKDALERLDFEVQYYDINFPCKVEHLVLPGFTAPTGNYNPTLINQVRKLLSPSRLLSPTRKIYISRQKARVRKILNEDEVQLLLKEFGFETHCFEDYTLGEQIAIMNETAVLLALHGAGLTNMLFMQEGTKVFELRNENDDHNNCYFSLASALNISYYYQFNKGDSKETFNVGIHVDIDALRRNLEAAL